MHLIKIAIVLGAVKVCGAVSLSSLSQQLLSSGGSGGSSSSSSCSSSNDIYGNDDRSNDNLSIIGGATLKSKRIPSLLKSDVSSFASSLEGFEGMGFSTGSSVPSFSCLLKSIYQYFGCFFVLIIFM